MYSSSHCISRSEGCIIYVPRNLEVYNYHICAIWRLRNSCAQSHDLHAQSTNFACTPNSECMIYCVARRIEDILDKRRLPP